MKRCPQCDTIKPLAEFYTWPSQASGLSWYCRPCIQAYDRARPRQRKDQQKHRAQIARWKRTHRDRMRLTNLGNYYVTQAIRKGLLVRPDTCEECGKVGRIDAAHADYARLLDVRWLCRSCHMRWDHADPKTLPRLIHLPHAIDCCEEQQLLFAAA